MPSSEIVCSEVAIIEAYAITKLTSIKIIGSGYATVGRPVVEDFSYSSIVPGVATIRVYLVRRGVARERPFGACVCNC